MPSERLFDEKSLRKLEQLALIANKVRAGAVKGERRSIKRGTSIEFADYRDYTRGDDLRRLDWNVYARLEKPFIKLLEEEEDLSVHVILDASSSMDWPPNTGFLGFDDPAQTAVGDTHKFRYGQRLAAALAAIGLSTGDRVSISLLVNEKVVDRWGPTRGRGQTLGMLSWVETLSARGTTNLNIGLRDYALRGGRAGLALVISDMLSPAGYKDGLSDLQGRGYEVALLHLLSPDELEPALAGDVRLIDMETGTPQDVTVDGAMRDLYVKRLREWREEIGSACTNRGVHYVTIDTSAPWESVILYALRRAGVVK
jgi:uncharacterized protein (DUF58 family)